MKKKPGLKKTKLKAAPIAAKIPKTKARKTRQLGVRARVLDMLSVSPRTSAALIKEGGFSPAALYLNIKALKADGLVKGVRDGREIVFSLAATPVKKGQAENVVVAEAVTSAVVTSRKPIKASAAMVIAYVPTELHEALNGLSRRLAPIEALADKLNVLDHLARTMPTPIASVLNAVAADLQRVASADTGTVPS